MAHPGLLMRAHNIQKSDAPWYTGRGFTVFDTQDLLNSLKRRDILKILIENVIKQPGPVESGQGRSVPVGPGAGRCRSVPVVPGKLYEQNSLKTYV